MGNGHCLNSFRLPPLCQTVKRGKKSTPNHSGKPLHPWANVGKKCLKPSWKAFTHRPSLSGNVHIWKQHISKRGFPNFKYYEFCNNQPTGDFRYYGWRQWHCLWQYCWWQDRQEGAEEPSKGVARDDRVHVRVVHHPRTYCGCFWHRQWWADLKLSSSNHFYHYHC